MGKTICLFLAATSIACGQDVVLKSGEGSTWVVHSNDAEIQPRMTFDDDAWRVERGNAFRPARSWNEFVIPHDKSIANARLVIPIRGGWARGDQTIIEDMQLVLHDGPIDAVLRIDPPLGSGQDVIDAADLAEQGLRQKAWVNAGSGTYYGALDVSPNSLNGWRDTTEPFDMDISWRFDAADIAVDLSPLAMRDMNANDKWSVGAMLTQASHLRELNIFGCCPESAGFVGNLPIRLELTYGPPPPIGDFDRSGQTDQADLDFVLLNWGMLDQEELDAVLLSWGSTSLGAAAVPEPASIVLLLIGCGLLAMRVRRQFVCWTLLGQSQMLQATNLRRQLGQSPARLNNGDTPIPRYDKKRRTFPAWFASHCFSVLPTPGVTGPSSDAGLSAERRQGNQLPNRLCVH